MYAYLAQRIPVPLLNLLVVGAQTGAIIVVVLLADKPFGVFAYMKM